MKPVVWIVVCAGLALPGTAVAMGNPASAFCQTMSGQLIIVKLPDGGEIGLCSLPGKKIVEEWTLYRMLGGVKPAENNNPFR